MSDAPQPGTLRGGRYVVIGVLGAGSQAETLDAVDKQGGRAVAIKRFQVRGAKSWKDVELAEREARVLSTLSHPNLPEYVEHFEEDGALYLVMGKIEGDSLAALRKRKLTLSGEAIARFLSDADSVLTYLHSRAPAIIHRDIKPGNVIRRSDGSFAFVDFGSVRDQLKPEGGSTVVGTFGYMAPEQFQGRALPGSDVYAVGATALAMVTGREPEDLPHRGLAIDVRAALGKSAEPWLVRALVAMLEPDPDKRPARVSTARPPPQSARESGESPRERGERRRRAERDSEPNSETESEWHRSEPWDLHSLREQGREHRRRLRDESRRMRRDIEERIAEDTRHYMRRYSREQRRSQRGQRLRQGHGFGPPRAIGLLVTVAVLLALTAARIGTWWLFRFFLPTLLFFLSVFFGRALRRAAYRCREVGSAGDRGLLHAMAVVRGRLLGGPVVDTEGSEVGASHAERTETETPETTEKAANPRARVEVGPEASPLPDDAELEARFEELRRREERRS